MAPEKPYNTMGSFMGRDQDSDTWINYILFAKVLKICENPYFVKGFVTEEGRLRTLVKSNNYILFGRSRHPPGSPPKPLNFINQ